jgi:hypothetical protein
MTNGYSPNGDEYSIYCPYCSTKYWDVDEGVEEDPLEAECGECGEKFEYWASYTVKYHSGKIVGRGK